MATNKLEKTEVIENSEQNLDIFTVKRKQGKPSAKADSISIRLGNPAFDPKSKRAMHYVSPGKGGWS